MLEGQRSLEDWDTESESESDPEDLCKTREKTRDSYLMLNALMGSKMSAGKDQWDTVMPGLELAEFA